MWIVLRGAAFCLKSFSKIQGTEIQSARDDHGLRHNMMECARREKENGELESKNFSFAVTRNNAVTAL